MNCSVVVLKTTYAYTSRNSQPVANLDYMMFRDKSSILFFPFVGRVGRERTRESMSRRNWLDILLDDAVGNPAEAPAEEDNSAILGFLHKAKEWEEAGKMKAHRMEINREYAKLGRPNGKKLIHTFMGLKGDALLAALLGAGALGRALEGHDGITLLSLSIVFAYIAQFVMPKVGRSILVLCRQLFYKNGTRKTEAFSKGIGCSKNRLSKALAEVMENGLAKPGGDGNAPGSGRLPFKTAFADMMTGYLMAVTGLDEEALEKELSCRHVELIQSAPDPDSNEAITDIPTMDSITTAFTELKTIAAEVDIRTDTAIGTADHGHAGELERMKNNLSAAMAQLGKVMEETAVLEGMDKKAEAASGSGDTGGSSPEEHARLDIQHLKARILPQFLSPIISLLTERCSGILEAFRETEGKNSYQLVKEAKRKAKPKSLVNRLALLWEDYRLILQDIDVMETERISEEASRRQADGPGLMDTYDIMTADVPGQHRAVQENLDIMIKNLSSASNADKGNVSRALGRLEKTKELLVSDRFQSFLSSDDQEVRLILMPMFCYLNYSCRNWLASWTEEGCKDSQCARKSADAILSERFGRGLASFLEQMNFYVQQKEEPSSASLQEANGQNSGNMAGLENDAAMDTPQNAQEMARTAALHALDVINVLMQALELSQKARIMHKNSKEGHVDGALAFLRSIAGQLENKMGYLERQENVWVSQTLLEIASWISALLEGRLAKWEKDGEGNYIIRYTLAEKIACSLSSKGYAAYLEDEWKRLEGIYDGTINPGKGRYVGIEEMGAVGEWFAPDASLSPEARCKLVLKLWEQGKDPRKIETWIDYIISDEYNRNYGDPSDRMKCCRITRTELQTAFHCLTGMPCSTETLWTILTKDMGYTGRQCAKLDQVGKASEHRDEQYRHIKEKQEKADPNHTLVISVDTKAFLLLGRLKHDSGKIMCRKDGRVYRVFDHDFALKLRQIYPHGTQLVDQSRLDENAVLHPVGVYCPEDGTGYVALVLGKDTAESVCNLIREVIDIKRKTRPELDTVLIMADGGGSNMANGVAWQSELLKLSDDKNVTLDVVHFAPGSSKHNLIEHRMFSEISRNWRGRPFIDIEHVLGYINSTRNKSLAVQGWFDTRRYETNTEKKARGEQVMTRAQLDRIAGDRITHEYPEGEMYKWNYVVRPSSLQTSTA